MLSCCANFFHTRATYLAWAWKQRAAAEYCDLSKHLPLQIHTHTPMPLHMCKPQLFLSVKNAGLPGGISLPGTHTFSDASAEQAGCALAARLRQWLLQPGAFLLHIRMHAAGGACK